MQTRIISLITIILTISLFTNYTKAQQVVRGDKKLSRQDQSIVTISALTAKGDLVKLKIALNTGLETGLTVNEIKEALVHLYAYCGFPRSIRGLQTFMVVLDERKAKGINDTIGKEASKIDETDSKYERGKKILSDLTKTRPPDLLSGYSAFAPTIDVFLKEHLFADIFERDVLSYKQRELVTISVLAAIGNSEPMLKSHLTISLHLGLTPEQLEEYVEELKLSIGQKAARSAQKTLDEVVKNHQFG